MQATGNRGDGRAPDYSGGGANDLGAHLRLARAALMEPLAVVVHDVRRSRLGAGGTALFIGAEERH